MNTKTFILTTAVVATLGFSAHATTYLDTTGDTFTGAGGGILDITSVEVNNNATDLIFKINVAGDPVATDWGKYMIGIDSVAGGDTAGDGWARPISMPSGMDYWVGSWVDSGNGAQLWQYTGAWANIGTPSVTKNISSVTLQFAYAGLGLAPGSTFRFDVYTSGGGGGDSAVDALANPAQSIANWGDPYSTQSPVSYTIPTVPEPGTLAMLGLGGLLMVQRAFRRRA